MQVTLTKDTAKNVYNLVGTHARLYCGPSGLILYSRKATGRGRSRKIVEEPIEGRPQNLTAALDRLIELEGAD